MASVTCRLTAEDRGQLRNPTLISSMELFSFYLSAALYQVWLGSGVVREQGSYSLKHIVRTIEQRSYDLRRRYDTTYSQNVSQTVIVSYVRYDVGASSLTNVLHFDRKNATRCIKTRYFDKKIQIIIITIIMNWLVS